MQRIPPSTVQHDWQREPDTKDVYRCSLCGQWTANLPYYKHDVCSARDRRKGVHEGRRSEDR